VPWSWRTWRRGGEYLWDLGTGSGAVAVEWLCSDGANRATAVDQREDRLVNVRENARLHGVGHLETLQADIADAIAQLERRTRFLSAVVRVGTGLSTKPGVPWPMAGAVWRRR